MRAIVGLFAAIVIGIHAHAASLADLSNTDATNGLKQALNEGKILYESK